MRAAHVWDVPSLPSLRFPLLISWDRSLLLVSSFNLSSLSVFTCRLQTVPIPFGFGFFCLLFPSSFHYNCGGGVELSMFPEMGR